MPISFQIDEPNQRIYSLAVGIISYSDLRSHMERPENIRAYSELFDARKAAPSMSLQNVRDLAKELHQRVPVHGPPGPIAFVAGLPVLFGMLRMYDALTNEIRPIAVFREVIEARTWLDELTKTKG